MSTSGSLVVISCNETDPRIDPSLYFNLSTSSTQSIKTPGGRTEAAIDNIYYADQINRIGMIVVVQHTYCTSSAGDIEANVRADIQVLKVSPYVRNDIPIIGYVLDVDTGQLREINIPRNGPDAEARRRVLSEMDDFGPFWS